MDLEERRVEEELDGGGPLLRVLLQALPEEVPLLLVLQLVDGRSDLLFRYGTFRISVLVRGWIHTGSIGGQTRNKIMNMPAEVGGLSVPDEALLKDDAGCDCCCGNCNVVEEEEEAETVA